MIFNIISLLIIIFSFVNYKKSFMIFLIYNMIWYDKLPFFSIGTVDVSSSIILSFVYFMLYFVKGNVVNNPKCSIPFSFPFLMIIISYVGSCFTTLSVFYGEFYASISNISRTILLFWLIWYVIEKKEDFEYIFHIISIMMLLACIYTFVEYFIGHNFLIDLKNTATSKYNYINTYDSFGGSVSDSRGYRISSIFEHPIGAGMTYALYSVVVFYLYVHYKFSFIKLKYLNFYLFVACLCIPCILLTKMRSSLLFYLLTLPSLLDFWNRRAFSFVLVSLLVFIVSLPFILSYVELFLSIFDSSSMYSVHGSNIEQRISQFNAASSLMNESPFWGLGGNGKFKIDNVLTKAMLGYESIWFDEMVSRGIFGVLANVILATYTIIIVPLKYNLKIIFWLSLSFWITATLTSVPSFRFSLYYFVIFGFIKMSSYYKNIDSKKLTCTKFKLT